MNQSGPSVLKTSQDEFLILIPVFNDWDSLELHLENLDRVLHAHAIVADLLIVDDGSTIAPDAQFCTSAYRSLGRIEIVTLRRNLGHQRAIAIGLAHVEARVPCRACRRHGRRRRG